jgi:hypothetical protein
MSVGMVKIGDYVQLKSLSVAKYNNQGSDITNAATLKVKVVGINPYKGTGLNTEAAKAHVVFQFEKVVTTRKMHSSSIDNYYSETEMRTYLTGNFYNGLKTAGVPDGVVWAVKRRIGANLGTEDLSDKVFLPTEREVFGSNTYAGTESNQGRLSAYQSASDRKKYNLGSSYVEWWLASVSGNMIYPTHFCSVDSSGDSEDLSCTNTSGVAPAFCIK